MLAVAGGDRVAFKTLYERTGAKLHATTRRILQSDAAAEDAVQEAFVRIWRRAGDYDAEVASPIAWMTTIARHAAIDMLRRGAERISAAAADPAIAETLADPASGADRLAVGSGLTRCLEALERRSPWHGRARLLPRLEPGGTRGAIQSPRRNG